MWSRTSCSASSTTFAMRLTSTSCISMSRRETTHTSCESESASPMISQSATGSFEKVRYDESFTASWHSSGSSSASGARPSRARFAL